MSGTTTGQLAQQLNQLPLKDLANNATAALQSVKRLADSLEKGLPPVLDSTASTFVKAQETLGATQKAIEELQTRTDTTLAAVDRLTGSADRQLNSRGEDLRVLLVSSNQAITNARDVLSNLKNMTDDRSPDRANLDAALNDLSAASSSLRGFASDIEQNPRLLLTGRRQ